MVALNLSLDAPFVNTVRKIQGLIGMLGKTKMGQKRVVITGACGTVGSALVENLVNDKDLKYVCLITMKSNCFGQAEDFQNM